MARILLVEDDDDLREGYAVFLRGHGHEIVEADSAEWALETWPDAVDLVVVDLLLPGMDGAEFSRMLRADADRSSLPIIMMSSMVKHMGIRITEADRRWAPIDRFIEKHAPLSDLAQAVQDLTNGLSKP